MVPVGLTDLQRAIQQYTDRHAFLAKAAPFTAAALARAFTKNKLASVAVVTSGAWLAIHNISASALQLIQDQLDNLQTILGNFRV